MKKIALSTLLLFFAVSGFAQPRMSVVEAARQADSLLSKMTLDEKISMTRGYSRFFFNGIERLGIPYIYLSDASQGVNMRHNLPDPTMVRQLEKSTAFPCPIMLAATFNPALAYDYARSIGEECRAGGVEVLLGPGLNIYRNSAVRPQFRVFRRGSVSHVAHHRELRAGDAEYRHGRLPETLPGQQHGILPPPFELDSRRTHDA